MTDIHLSKAIRQVRKALGLEPSFADYVLPAIGALTIGLVAGAGIALLMTPMTGKDLRSEMEKKLSDLRARGLLADMNGSANKNNNHAASMDNSRI